LNRIIVKDVSKNYGKTCVVDRVSFEVRSGEILGFLGPNGAGKTTTIRMMMGITAPDEGEVTYECNGSIEKGIPQSAIGYLPEERGLYKEARVLSILQFLAGLKDIRRADAKVRAVQWLTKLGLKDYVHSKVEELSKGMAQKVQFIGAVLHKPGFVVLDEPFSGLDPVAQDAFKTELRALAANGAAILLSGHQMNILEELCDRIYLIHRGKHILSGTLAEVKERFGNFRVKVKTADPKSLAAIISMPQVIEYNKTGENQTLLTLAEDTIPTAFLNSLSSDLSIQEFSLSRSSLHDIFVKVALGGIDEI